MKPQKIKGATSFNDKTIAKEDLPGRCGFGYTTITGGDLYKRSGNFYGKAPVDGEDTQPSAIALFTAIGRSIGMA